MPDVPASVPNGSALGEELHMEASQTSTLNLPVSEAEGKNLSSFCLFSGNGIFMKKKFPSG